MATVQQVLDKTLKILVVAGAESSISSSDAEDFIFTLNNYMNDLEGQQYVDTTVTPNVTYGINFNWADVDDVSDTVPLAAAGIRGLCYCLAYELAPEYGVQLTPHMERLYRNGYASLIRVGRNMKTTQLPETLPQGSGNEDDGVNFERSGHFFP
jgi:hypothetical protein